MKKFLLTIGCVGVMACCCVLSVEAQREIEPEILKRRPLEGLRVQFLHRVHPNDSRKVMQCLVVRRLGQRRNSKVQPSLADLQVRLFHRVHLNNNRKVVPCRAVQQATRRRHRRRHLQRLAIVVRGIMQLQ